MEAWLGRPAATTSSVVTLRVGRRVSHDAHGCLQLAPGGHHDKRPAYRGLR